MPRLENGEKFSVPSQGMTRGSIRPDAPSFTALEVYLGIQERQSRQVVVSTNEAVAALAERVEILEEKLAQRNRIPRISIRLSEFLTPQLRSEAILW